jgi:acyl-CoA synthetase (AMP-forming)/AMP-acid ligase II
MIKSAGANVAPAEVEAALVRQPGVREAIVFGIPDSARGEAVVAIVIAQGNALLSADTLRTALRTEVSSYKVPCEIRIMVDEDVPRTGSGKANKTALRRLFGGASAPS